MNDLLAAVARNDSKEAIRLLDAGFDPNTKDPDGRIALMHAVIDGRDELVKLLIARCSDVNAQDKQGFSALHFAAQDYRQSATDALLKAGATVDARDKFGNTPLGRAVFNSRGRGDIIKLLLEHGADRNAKNNSGKSPLDLANTIGNYDVKLFFN
jgi:ankyrin repeat protein